MFMFAFAYLFLPDMVLTDWPTDTRKTWMKWTKTKTTTTRMERHRFFRRFLRSQNSSRRRTALRIMHRFLTSVCFFFFFWLIFDFLFLMMSGIIFPQRVVAFIQRTPVLRCDAFALVSRSMEYEPGLL